MDIFRQSDKSRTEKNEQKSLYLAADPTSGHMGLKKKTVARIAERFAWKGMTKDVKRIVSSYKHWILILFSLVDLLMRSVSTSEFKVDNHNLLYSHLGFM